MRMATPMSLVLGTRMTTSNEQLSTSVAVNREQSGGRAGEPPLLQMRDAVVRRAGREILNVENFTLDHGENVVILGPNGAGKSTFIRLFTREIFPLHRDIAPVLFCGKERATLQEVKSAMAVVSATMQDQITVHLPVIEIVAGGLFHTLGLPHGYEMTDDDRQRAMTSMEMLGIAALADRDVMTLSSGQARRVLIARELVYDPEVLVFDEPCTGLDPEGMFYVRRSMRNLVRSGKSIMLVTHYPEDIIPEISRVVMIKDGVVFDDGAKQDLLTDERMSDLFDVPMKVLEQNGYYSLVSEY